MGNRGPLQVYKFYINDDNAESPEFGCIAHSQSEAHSEVEKLGYQDYHLAEVRGLRREETATYSALMVSGSPYLGKPWFGTFRVIGNLIKKLNFNDFLRIHTYGARFGCDPDRSPYVQILKEFDGSLFVEVSDNKFLSPKISNEELELLAFLGWEKGEEDEFSVLPNHFRRFEAGWNPFFVAFTILEALVSVYKLTPKDHFNFGEGWQPEFVAKTELLERIRGAECNPKRSIFRPLPEPSLEKLGRGLDAPYELLTDKEKDCFA